MVEPDNKDVPLTLQAKILSLSRSSLHYKRVGSSESEIRPKYKIDEIYTRHPVYGSRRITVELLECESQAGSTVQRENGDFGALI